MFQVPVKPCLPSTCNLVTFLGLLQLTFKKPNMVFLSCEISTILLLNDANFCLFSHDNYSSPLSFSPSLVQQDLIVCSYLVT